jgi:succinoglycan biosynthesis protein ExoA
MREVPLPTVSIVMPAARAADTIGRSLLAIAAQDYPNIIEVVVAAADPETADAARSLDVRVVENPSGHTPVGLNMAITSSSGEIVVRVDAHSVISPSYVSTAVSTLLDTGADNVGGMQVPVGGTFWSRAIAAAMSSPAGSGDARYRIGGQPGPVDTVYLGTFRRSTLERLGGYDENFKRHQDYELNERIRRDGGTVWFDPDLRVIYEPRSSLALLARQYFEYGSWKRWFSSSHRGSLRPRQFAPPLLVVGMALSLIGSFVSPWFLTVPTVYVVGLVAAALSTVRSSGVAALGVPAALVTMHFAWGLGFLLGHSRER